MSCHKGILTPPSIPCESGLRKSRQELEHATPTPHPKMEHNELDNDHDHHDNSTDEHDDMKYVKKIVNNKQIMYDCDKGYVLEVKNGIFIKHMMINSL